MNFKKNLIFLSALALCGSAAFSGFGNSFFNISSSVSVSAEENNTAYQWYLEPSIDADEVYTYDFEAVNDGEYMDEKNDVYDWFAIVKKDDFYNIVDYNGKQYLKEKYINYFEHACVGIMLDKADGEEVTEDYTRDYNADREFYNGWADKNLTIWYNSDTEKIEFVKGGSNAQGHGGTGMNLFVVENNELIMYFNWIDIQFDGLEYVDRNNTIHDSQSDKEIPLSEYNKNHAVAVVDIDKCKYGLYFNNELIVPYEYDKYYEDNNFIWLGIGDNWELYNKNGNKVFDFSCKAINANSDIVSDHFGNYYDTISFHDDTYSGGTSCIPYLPTENKFAIYNDNGCAYFGTDGTQITNYGEFEEIRPVHNNLAWVKKDGKWGVIQFGEDNTYTMPEITKIGDNTPTETAAWKDAYIEIMNTEKSSSAYYNDSFKFDLYDIDSDGIPELFISKGPAIYNGVDIYTFDGENAIKLVNDLYMMGIVGVSKKNNMVESGLYNHGYDGHSYWTKNGNSLDSLCYFNFDEGATETRHWFVNGEEVSVKEYCDSINKYYSDDWVSVGRTYEYSDAESAMNKYIENGYNVDLPNSSDYVKYEFPSKEYIASMYEYAGVDPSEPEKTQKSWQKAYADFISGKGGKFSLVYIDNDDIPELICATSDGGSGISIYKYSDGEVISIDNCGFADNSTNKSVAYLEKQNLICVTDARTNGKYYYLYTIENDELKEKGNISFNYLNNDFSIDGNPATEDECNAKADEYKIPDMTVIDRDAMYDINEENVIKYLSVENDTEETEKSQDNNTNNNNNNNNNTKNNTTNNGGKSATADKTGVSPDTGDKGTGIALCVAASAVMAAWITRKKD